MLKTILSAFSSSVGGQAVMEGVMMRDGDNLAIAVRKQSGDIKVEVRPWFSMMRYNWMKKPYVRGFPILVETMVNGIKALNFSAQEALDEEEEEVGSWALAGTVAFAVVMALGLFVVLPHLVSMAFNALGWAGGVKSLSFHAWDGLFKFVVFVGYILAISLVPDIRRVFQYHGAEHKSIWAYESGGHLTPAEAKKFSRLHPRCGTTFLLFVLAISIVLYAVLVPALLFIWSPEGTIWRQLYALLLKLVFMVPVSCVAYELIKAAGKHQDKLLFRVLSWPGMFMQLLTTHEPDEQQLQVAIAALKGAVGERVDKADVSAADTAGGSASGACPCR
ncbi:MAG: DUF1385 domain-containing protein [Desulfovibrio sp.]|uniref:DUF1385 domain-containing protein n=1 Tax=Desulfovibrio sp. 7SRBS1 TaxID=3378064 RepID=UPI003B3CC9D7